MDRHSVADARNHLSALIDRALAGKCVVITRHGHPVVELRPVVHAAAHVTATDLDWLASRRVGKRQAKQDARALVSAMRDDDGR